MRFDSLGAAVNSAGELTHLGVGDAINIEAVALAGGDTPSTGVRCLDEAHLLELGHLAADGCTRHTKQLR